MPQTNKMSKTFKLLINRDDPYPVHITTSNGYIIFNQQIYDGSWEETYLDTPP